MTAELRKKWFTDNAYSGENIKVNNFFLSLFLPLSHSVAPLSLDWCSACEKCVWQDFWMFFFASFLYFSMLSCAHDTYCFLFMLAAFNGIHFNFFFVEKWKWEKTLALRSQLIVYTLQSICLSLCRRAHIYSPRHVIRVCACFVYRFSFLFFSSVAFKWVQQAPIIRIRTKNYAK